MPKTILVIDDSASARQAISGTLAAAGYAVIEACDGEDALAKLDGSRIHLIVCDVLMPRMDGIRFVEEAKKRPDCRFTPIVMLTTVAQERKKFEGQIAGAKAWVVKPFLPAQILDVIAKLIAH